MDLQPKITEAIAEHLTVIQQLTAMSSLILQVANSWSQPSDARGRWSCVGMGEVRAMRNISLPKCRVSARIQVLLRDCWRSS
jgi:hypothetical protein